jgi:hypothetical protein
MLLQLSPASVVYNVTQPGSSAVGTADGEDAVVLIAAAVYGGGEVNGYPVLAQEEVSDAKSEAKSSSYPKGELSCIWDAPSMQSEQFCAAVSDG